VNHVKRTNGKLHILGLISEGEVHSSLTHLFALLNFAKQNQIQKLFIHAITDGRDSPPKAAEGIVSQIEQKITETQVGKIATVMGRYWGMDRDRRWERTETAYRCLTQGVGQQAIAAKEAITAAYGRGETDEFIAPTVVTERGK